MAFITLLELEGDGDGVGEGKVGVVVVDEATLFVEAKIAELKCFCSAFLVWNISS